MVFWTLSLWIIALIARDDSKWSSWLWFGLTAGLCMMSKVHGSFLWLGMGAYILFQRRTWLKKPQLYMAALISCIVISPIILWNVKYHFATYEFHSSRVEIDTLAIHWNYFIKEVASQLGFNNPLNVVLVASALLAWYRKKIKFSPALAVYNFVGLPLVFLLLFISLFRNVTLPHWSGPAYVSLLPIAAIGLAEKTNKPFPRVLHWALGIFLVTYLAWSAAVKFYPGTFGSVDKDDRGKGDITLDMYGWRDAGKQFEELYRSDVSKGIMPENAALVSSHWWGAHAEYYFGRPVGLKMLGIGEPKYLNQYLWTNKRRMKETDPEHAYAIIPTDEKYYVPADFYEKKELAMIIEIKRGGKNAHDFLVYRLKGLKKEIPVVK
jgi:hypothetical protein